MEKILVVDFGGQYAHLIANRLRRLGFLADITNNNDLFNEIKRNDNKNNNINNANIKGIIFSGGPSSVYEKNSPSIDKKILNANIPILGLCYGHQLIAHKLKGKVQKGSIKEYGLTEIKIKKSSLFKNLKEKQIVWMSHGDSVKFLPKEFKTIAFSKDCEIAGMENSKKKIYGLQFHPEVIHTKNGTKILENFAKEICNCEKSWNTKEYFKNISKDIIKKAKNKKVFLLVSGGVDSVVLFTLLNKVLGKENVFGLHVDTGLMRLNESKEVENALKKLKFDNLEILDASEKFISALKNISDPEEKRKIIGDLFVDIAGEESNKKLSSKKWLIAQGTIYPDTIESKGTKNADLIKTHHNRVPKMQELILKGKVIEPLSHLYKDEVRMLGKILGLPDELINRHPFPGPGLAIRILCNNKNQEDITLIEEKLKQINKNSFVLPVKSVGVQGDSRTYKHPAVLTDWKTWDELERVSTHLTNKVSEINRVLLLIKKKEGSFKLEKKTITKSRIDLLKKADFIANKIIKENKLCEKIWQMPVVLIPISTSAGGESIILRPVDSQEAMTANFSKINKKIVDKIASELMKIEKIDAVFYDITNKPPATIEWE